MEEIKVVIEVEGEVEQANRFSIEDAIMDALKKIGIEVTKVQVFW